MNTEEELQEIKKRICSILGVSESYTYEEIEHALKGFKHADEQYTELANDLCYSKQNYANLKVQFDSLMNKMSEAAKDEKANYFVYNARRDVPNKVYKSKQEALEDAKQLAYKEVNPIFVLKLESLIIPHCELNIHDISEKGIPDKFLNQYDSVQTLLSENEIPF